MKQLYSNNMKQNTHNHSNTQNNTPYLFSVRQRLNSVNSPFISPLRLVQSPILNPDNLFDFQLKYQNFQLEPQNPIQDQSQQVQISNAKFEVEKQELIDLSNLEIDQNNVLDVILKNINQRDSDLNLMLAKLNQNGKTFLAQVFQYLFKKFKKLKKTKEEIIKYSMRKAFRYISDRLKIQMPNYAVDTNQYLQFYFNKYQQTEQITVPFKKDSLERTINSAFLKKIFTIDKFVSDYKSFLKIFKKEYMKDNDKKIQSIKDILKQVFKTKCFKSIDSFKRLPWTSDILSKLQQYSKGLLDYIPPKKGSSEVENIIKNDDFFEQNHDYSMEKPKKQQETHLKEDNFKHKTKSVIILTPPMHPMNSPNLPDFE